MNPIILILKSSENKNVLEDYDIIIVHPDNSTQEEIDHMVVKAKERFIQLSHEENVRSMRQNKPPASVIKQLPDGERKKRKRIYR